MNDGEDKTLSTTILWRLICILLILLLPSNPLPTTLAEEEPRPRASIEITDISMKTFDGGVTLYVEVTFNIQNITHLSDYYWTIIPTIDFDYPEDVHVSITGKINNPIYYGPGEAPLSGIWTIEEEITSMPYETDGNWTMWEGSFTATLTPHLSVRRGSYLGDPGELLCEAYGQSVKWDITIGRLEEHYTLDADFTLTPERPTTSDMVVVIDQSKAINCTIVEYRWYLDDTPLPDTASSITLGRLTEGMHTLRLVVRDEEGHTDEETKTFEVIAISQWSLSNYCTCTSISNHQPLNIKRAFRTQDGGVFLWMEFVNVSNPLPLNIIWYTPEGWVFMNFSYTLIPDQPHSTIAFSIGYDSTNPTYGELMAHPGVWRYRVYAERWLILEDTFKVAAPSLQGYVEDGHGHRLENVTVRLYWNGTRMVENYTDESGFFNLRGSFLKIPMRGEGYIVIVLADREGIFKVVDRYVGENIVVEAGFPITITDEGDLLQEIRFPTDVGDDPSTPVREDHLDDLAYIYYNTFLAAKFYRRKMKIDFKSEMLMVYAYERIGDNAYFQREGPLIVIGDGCSNWNYPDAPVNREFHEFSHYAMWYTYGKALPPLHKGDDNHKGVKNHCTSDSWIEGFAEFMALVINDEMRTKRLPIQWMWVFSNFADFYPVGEAFYPLEPNWPHDGDLEEFSVASILYDLWDGEDERDSDNVQMKLEDLWEILTGKYSLPKYYEDESGKWVGDKGRKEVRHIHYVADLHDALISHSKERKEDIDALFISHGFYTDKNKNGVYDSGEPVGYDASNSSHRRKMPLNPNSTIVVELPDEDLPATLLIEVLYKPPYEDYSYEYSMEITNPREIIPIRLPPPGYNATASLKVVREGYHPSETATLTSDFYWTHLGLKEHIATYHFDIRRESSIKVVNHLTCKGVDQGKPMEVTSTFKSDDTVFSFIEIEDGEVGDEILWRFQGPVGQVVDVNYTLEWSGGGSCWAYLDLTSYKTQEAVGEWTVTVYINGMEASSDVFTVEALGGLVWWGPFLGVSGIALFMAILLLLIRRLRR